MECGMKSSREYWFEAKKTFEHYGLKGSSDSLNNIYKLHISLSEQDYDKYKTKIISILRENDWPYFKCTNSAAIRKKKREKDLKNYEKIELQRFLSGDQFTVYIPENWNVSSHGLKIVEVCCQIEDALIDCEPGKHLSSEIKLTEHINIRQEKIWHLKCTDLTTNKQLDYNSASKLMRDQSGFLQVKYKHALESCFYFIDQDKKEIEEVTLAETQRYVRAIPRSKREKILSPIILDQLKKSAICMHLQNQLNALLLKKYQDACTEYLEHLKKTPDIDDPQTPSGQYASKKRNIIQTSLEVLNNTQKTDAERVQGFRESIIQNITSSSDDFDFFARRDDSFLFFLKVVGVLLSLGFAYDNLFGEKATEGQKLLRVTGIYKSTLESYKNTNKAPQSIDAKEDEGQGNNMRNP